MDRVSSSIDELSAAVSKFRVGVVVFDQRSDYEPLKQIEDAFKIRRSKALLECAYNEQKYGAMENSEGFSSCELEKPRLFRREKLRTECQQAATQGMTAFCALQHIICPSQLNGGTLDSVATNEGSMKSKWCKFTLELSKDTWVSFGEGYNELLIAEKSMFEEALRFQEVFAKLKKGKECMTTSASNDTKMKLSMAQAGLDKMNFMRRLIILLVGVKDVDLKKHRDIWDIVLHRCNQLNLLDDILNC